MSHSENVRPFLEPIAALQRLISKFDGKAIIIGGIAVSLIAAPRLTVDIDAMVLFPIEDIHSIIEAATKEGFATRILAWISTEGNSPNISANSLGLAET